MRLLVLAVNMLLLCSCTTLVPPPDVELADVDPQEAWERVLTQHVDARGSIDFDRLRENGNDLDLYVAWLARKPESRLAGSEQIAHLVNAYNALAMYNVLHGGVLPGSKIRFFYLRRLIYEDARISLYALENKVIRRLGEPRIHFALNCMVRSCPRLPREPFDGATLDQRLDAAAREFMNDPRHVTHVPEQQEVWLSAILDWYEQDFLEVAPSLLAYVNRYRDEPVPEDWKVRFLPYDWTLNTPPAVER